MVIQLVSGTTETNSSHLPPKLMHLDRESIFIPVAQMPP